MRSYVVQKRAGAATEPEFEKFIPINFPSDIVIRGGFLIQYVNKRCGAMKKMVKIIVAVFVFVVFLTIVFSCGLVIIVFGVADT